MAQTGEVSGIINDPDGLPLPGTTIQISGKSTGTQTDFDGKYSIICNVGDVLVFSYVGFKSWEVTVTEDMFDNGTYSIIKLPVVLIQTDAYAKALEKELDSSEIYYTKSLEKLNFKKKQYYFQYTKIKDIDQENDSLLLDYFKEDFAYEIEYSGTISWLFANKNSLPQVQNRYGQGRPSNGVNQYYGPETNEIFSFGAPVANLTFTNEANPYDVNGQIALGTGSNHLPYQNEILNTTKVVSNSIHFIVGNYDNTLGFKYRNKSHKDLFDIEKSRIQDGEIRYNYKNHLEVFAKLYNERLNQPDINGFYNNVLFSNAATPVTFQNNQGYLLNGAQRSFSPENFNNPLWLLHQNSNGVSNTSAVLSSKGTYNSIQNIKLTGQVSYQQGDYKEQFGLPLQTIGYLEGYQYDKRFKTKDFRANFLFDLETEVGIDWNRLNVISELDYSFNKLNYLRNEIYDVISIVAVEDLQNSVLRFRNEVGLELREIDLSFRLGNNATWSAYQGTEVFLPFGKIVFEKRYFDYWDWINSIRVEVAASKGVSEMPLYYGNQSHNSLNLSVEEATSYKAVNDLFLNEAIDFETNLRTDFGMSVDLFNNKINLDFTYYKEHNKDVVFPIATTEGFQLQNIADINNRGFEIALQGSIGDYSSVLYVPKFIFSKQKAIVEQLYGTQKSVAIAGFSDVSKNLIEGEQIGSIVGSSYVRDTSGSLIIGDSGYPIVAQEPTIIGNTTPDFNVAFESTLEISSNKFTLNVLFDWQQGGDVWNGTNNMLNYLGRSRESGDLRGVHNYVFPGVTTAGDLNTTAVSFASANDNLYENRWVRYGYSGVAEDAIKDASFLNLKAVSFTYRMFDNKTDSLFRDLEISVYAHNIWCVTKTKGVAPYTSLFNTASGSGLHYFNMPLLKEVGLKLNLKI
ncbi:carboxypeptidase-like regulatory domain-containing protein [Neptunitalea lumnitzerae]|uniref:TonB-dependent receptor n=1 Tax=Neptunitalea lumnitzerae TaxID=2965509 RepID=A0ABQ5MEE0_9FLAO|nr:carboxypeptidase-like regulatory domain-containing protein [Neptunitalea sp. Y10]GLB47745.1 hypothetical protein Y10_01130 [Neptunitalea sp. Y10]